MKKSRPLIRELKVGRVISIKIATIKGAYCRRWARPTAISIRGHAGVKTVVFFFPTGLTTVLQKSEIINQSGSHSL